MDVQKEISLRNSISYCIENNDANTATNRIMEFIRDEKEAINYTHCCETLNDEGQATLTEYATELINVQEYKSNELYTLLCTVRDGLNDEIIKINSTTLKDDFGRLDVQADPMQLKSFARGRSIGLIIARDRIEKALIEYSA